MSNGNMTNNELHEVGQKGPTSRNSTGEVQTSALHAVIFSNPNGALCSMHLFGRYEKTTFLQLVTRYWLQRSNCLRVATQACSICSHHLYTTNFCNGGVRIDKGILGSCARVCHQKLSLAKTSLVQKSIRLELQNQSSQMCWFLED